MKIAASFVTGIVAGALWLAVLQQLEIRSYALRNSFDRMSDL